MPDPTGRVSHLPHFHRGVAWKEPVRVATTGNITISTALNNGDTIDGVTLATGDRVLVKDQSTGSQNGIYVVGASPARAYDMDQDGTTTVPAEEIAGAFAYVIAGTVNAGTLWHTTNVVGGTLGSSTISFEEFTAGGSASGGGGFDITPAQSVPMPAWVKPSGTGVITADPQGRITVDSNTEYKAFPGMTLQEGVLHAVWREGTAHNSDTGLLKYKRSYDLGRTWTSATTLITPAGDLDVRDPNIVALNSGRLLVTYNLREYDTSPDEIFAWRIYSDNRGQSWSSPAAIPMSFSGQQIVSGQAVEMPSGEILLPVFGDNGGFYIAAALFSTDDGDTFGNEATIATGTHDWEEPVVRYLSSGNTVALLRDSLGTVTYRAVSTDGGHTWGAATSVNTNGAGRPDFVEFYPRALFMCNRSNDANLAARWFISWDEGATWSSAQEVDTGETDELEYSAPVVIAPGYLALLYSIEDGSDAHIYIRFYRDGFGTNPLGNADLAGLTVDGVPFDLSDPDDGEVLTYDSGSSSLILAPSTGGATLDEVAAAGFVGAILIDDTHSTPLVFGDLLQNDDQDDLLYADVPLP